MKHRENRNGEAQSSRDKNRKVLKKEKTICCRELFPLKEKAIHPTQARPRRKKNDVGPCYNCNSGNAKKKKRL